MRHRTQARREGGIPPTKYRAADGGCSAREESSFSPKGETNACAVSPAPEGAMRGFVLGRSRAEPTKTRRVAQDCDPTAYMYMSSGRKDALIGRFSWASTVARNKAARWKANQHRASTRWLKNQTFSQRLPFLFERSAASTKRMVRTPSCAPGKSWGFRSRTAAQNSR